jgi:ATP-dependent RNA helicase DeaD
MLEQLGMRDELVQAAASLGFREATALQASAIPVLRRGGNLVLNASTGAGVTMAYALPLLDRISQNAESATGPQILVLVPTEDRASRKAQLLARLARTVGLRASALAPGWGRKTEAAVVVATAESARMAVERSELKLDALQAFVLVDANMQLGENADPLNALMASIPRDAQRVITAAEVNAEVERYVDAYVRKAMHVPARSDDPAAPVAVTGDLDYIVVPESRKESQLVRLLEQRLDSRPVVVVRSAASGEAVRDALALRGFNAGGEAGSEVRIVAASEAAGASNEISYDVPFEAETLKKVHASGGLVMVTPPELPHLRRIASAAGLSLKAERVQQSASNSLTEYRRMLRQAVHDEDVDAQMAVLDPLFDEFSPAEIAAALSALVRKRVVPRAATVTTTGAPRPASAQEGFIRLFLSVGSRDNVRPGDLVGAITGESGVTGDQVGKVDIKDSFTVVEIATSVAEKVIRAMNGTTMRGRSLRVDYDRKGAAGREQTGDVRGGRNARDNARDSGRGGRDTFRRDFGRGADGPPRRDRSR